MIRARYIAGCHACDKLEFKRLLARSGRDHRMNLIGRNGQAAEERRREMVEIRDYAARQRLSTLAILEERLGPIGGAAA